MTELSGNPIRVACIGGGQLGRMMALEAPRLNIEMKFLDASGLSCPSAQAVPSANILEGSLQDAEKIKELAQDVDVVTVEIEHINVNALNMNIICRTWTKLTSVIFCR